MSITARLARLEKATGGGWLYIIEAGEKEDFDPEGWLTAKGHDVSPRDLIVTLLKFGPPVREPQLISAQPIG